MAVMLQAFYWDCPREDHQEYQWWKYVTQKIPALARSGFNSLWLPPVHKAANIGGPSMGYDPYDYYDLGQYNQKGSKKTWFGSKQELLQLIRTAHQHGLTVIADMVINHNNGADATEINPITGQTRWTLFRPKSGRFPRNWECFHPNCYESWDESAFGEMPDLSHRNPYVFGEIIKLARWLIEEIGFDGFRYDFVKGYGAHTVTAIQEYRYLRDGKPFQPYGVAEHWDTTHAIERWLDITNFSNQNPVDAFDFPLRELLKAMCDQYGFSLRQLVTSQTLLQDHPSLAVTFVENHDLRDEGREIINDKLLAYSFILTHEGYPCVFWKDYFNYGLALPDTANGIDALMNVHHRFAGGRTEVLWVDDNFYIMQRTGYEHQPGLIYVLNNRGDGWRGEWVTCQWRNTDLVPVAWWSRSDLHSPSRLRAEADGRIQCWAPPRGFAVFAPNI
ncbi:MAG: alpha-amylase family glycosyl hydrolase [candidate division KSB1 bacterium]|nr:alpha-amylase family glycosyl hydrolase [candidate division KSB1 bacterium]MDZ7318062.1 alpha-amylase family glycosyl hydrolase [candidate division KSB1 bacterium]MDZ7339755.1 alpha-amylase family glycosyl hydrolase [candidate division KSB1 bacterium]